MVWVSDPHIGTEDSLGMWASLQKPRIVASWPGRCSTLPADPALKLPADDMNPTRFVVHIP